MIWLCLINRDSLLDLLSVLFDVTSLQIHTTLQEPNLGVTVFAAVNKMQQIEPSADIRLNPGAQREFSALVKV